MLPGQEAEDSNLSKNRNTRGGPLGTALQSKTVSLDLLGGVEYAEVILPVCSLDEIPPPKEPILLESKQSTLRMSRCRHGAGEDGFHAEKHGSQPTVVIVGIARPIGQ